MEKKQNLLNVGRTRCHKSGRCRCHEVLHDSFLKTIIVILIRNRIEVGLEGKQISVGTGSHRIVVNLICNLAEMCTFMEGSLGDN